MFKEREAKITRLFFAFLMFVWLATSSSFVGAEGASGNYVHVADGKYSTGTSYSTITNPPDTDIPSNVGGVVGGIVSDKPPTDASGYYTEAIIGGQVSSGEASNNQVLVENGDFKFVYGSDGDENRTSTDNSVIIRDGNIDSVYATRSASIAQINTATMEGGTIREIRGGTSQVSGGKASDNQVRITGDTVTGYALAGSAYNGASAENNSTSISGGEVKGLCYGALVGVGGIDNSIGDATAKNNGVYINGGTVGTVYGAYSWVAPMLSKTKYMLD